MMWLQLAATHWVLGSNSSPQPLHSSLNGSRSMQSAMVWPPAVCRGHAKLSQRSCRKLLLLLPSRAQADSVPCEVTIKVVCAAVDGSQVLQCWSFDLLLLLQKVLERRAVLADDGCCYR